jgi:hypothetical protein
MASLPCYLKENVDFQQGNRVFDKSIRALKKLNQIGYGEKGSDLTLNLVYNPLGAFFPLSQKTLEEAYRRERVCLWQRVLTSSRRWETKGFLCTIFLMWFLRLAHLFKADSKRLAKLYYPKHG